MVCSFNFKLRRSFSIQVHVSPPSISPLSVKVRHPNHYTGPGRSELHYFIIYKKKKYEVIAAN